MQQCRMFRWMSWSPVTPPNNREGTRMREMLTVTCGLLVVCTALSGPIHPTLPAVARQASVVSQDAAAASDAAASEASSEYRSALVRGRVVWMAEALKEQFQISTVPEVAENNLAIQTADGRLIPIAENIRGRAFRKDERLRDMEVELLVRRHTRQPFVQIIRVYELADDDQRFEVDYWCDVCAINMFEPGPCSCCQDDNRIRKRLVEDFDPTEVTK